MNASLSLLVLLFILAAFPLRAQNPWQHSASSNELVWALGFDPKTLDPAKVDDQSAELVRYMTGGVLLRLDRRTLALEPSLAQDWQTSADGRVLTFHLRKNLRFSDGSPLSSRDVVWSLQRVLAPTTEAPVAEEFLEPAKVHVDAPDPWTVRVSLTSRVVAIGTAFDEIAIEPAGRPSQGRVTSGPFAITAVHPGQAIELTRNRYFWQHDSAGVQLPYLASMRLEILGNREAEELRFLRGQYAVLDAVPPEAFNSLHQRSPNAFHDLGPSLNTEQMWFNQSPQAPLPAWEKSWFTNRAFRNAVSEAIHRQDLVRVAFNGHATPANGFVSPSNTTWYNRALPPVRDDSGHALQLLAKEGFYKQGNQLFDRNNHLVTFSILVNAGNRARERMATLIQQDLAVLGMQVNIVTLDFPAMIERLMHSADYEAALLGLNNVQPDPSSLSNIWLSSSPNHQWNPSQPTPATPWEAEIDRAMRLQAGTADFKTRKAAVDRVQAIVAEQQPFIYLVYPNVLCGTAPTLDGLSFSVLQPNVLANVETVRWRPIH